MMWLHFRATREYTRSAFLRLTPEKKRQVLITYKKQYRALHREKTKTCQRYMWLYSFLRPWKQDDHKPLEWG